MDPSAFIVRKLLFNSQLLRKNSSRRCLRTILCIALRCDQETLKNTHGVSCPPFPPGCHTSEVSPAANALMTHCYPHARCTLLCLFQDKDFWLHDYLVCKRLCIGAHSISTRASNRAVVGLWIKHEALTATRLGTWLHSLVPSLAEKGGWVSSTVLNFLCMHTPCIFTEQDTTNPQSCEYRKGRISQVSGAMPGAFCM